MRIRDVLAVIVGLGVLGAVGYGGWLWLSDTIDEDTSEEADPLRTSIDDYVTAWETGDHLSMMTIVRGEPPEDFEQVHSQLLDGLQASGLSIDVGEVDDSVEGRAVAPLTLNLDVPVMSEPLSWDTELRLIRDRGNWEVEWSLSTVHPELRPTWWFDSQIEDVERAPIVGIDGTELAGDGQLMSFGIVPDNVLDADRVVRTFERAIPGSGERVERELARDNLVGDWYYPIVTMTEARAEELVPELRGVTGIDGPRRVTGQARALVDDGFAQHVVGIVGEPTAEEIEELGDEYEEGRLIGRYGLEAVFDEQMVGGQRYRAGIRDREEGPFRVLIGEGQEEGSGPVETTLDVSVQRAVENTLRGIEEPAAIVVVDGTDGGIRAAASRPLTGWNRAFEGSFPPGSTFKVITAEALLATGMAPDDEVACPAETTVGGLRVPNAGGKDLGTTTFETAFAESCNTTFATLAASELSGEALAEAAERFGFGVDPIVPLAAAGATFPTPADAAELGAASFGQARVEASVLHMASVAAATATGVWRQPFLLQEDGPGESRQLATGALEPLKRMMQTTVTDGTGTDAAVDGEVVGGKTGTAQTHDDLEHAWYIGTWEDYGFAILVEGGGAGSEVAAPLAGTLVRELIALITEGEDPLEPADGEPEEGAESGGGDGGDADAEPESGDDGADG